MNARDIRQSFIDFFVDRDHRRYDSAPLVPHGDPTLLFTNAGMVQFKDFFLGTETPPGPRAVSVQKCLRVSGKHNDLENVGPSPRHHTFFEMLGNFSFGDYFKEEAIRFGWDLVTEGWGFDKDHLFATVFHEDDDAFELWRKLSGLPEQRILRCGAKDNFWAMGETGPCGPCSEIFVDLHPDRPQVDWDEGSDSGRYLEIWNLVFMQFARQADGSMEPLPKPSVDTGAGLERVAATRQGLYSNYETDLFRPILDRAAEMAGTRYGRDAGRDVDLRVIADHLRAVSFLLADGVIPGPDGRGYVLRRLLRRAVRHGMRLGFEEPFLHRLVPKLGEVLGDAYPELRATAAATGSALEEEEEKFLSTVATGAQKVQERIEDARHRGEERLGGAVVFDLYQTLGLPLESIREIAEEERFQIDQTGFEAALEEERQRSRQATSEAQGKLLSLREALRGDEELGATPFEGYDAHEDAGIEVLRLALLADDGSATAATAVEAGRRAVAVLAKTVLYAESGGQVGDQGRLFWTGGRARVLDTRKDTAGTVFHFVEVAEGRLGRGERVSVEVAQRLRRATERNHTATHLLHAALREVLGLGVRQAGSLVAPDRLRFDFTHPHPLSDDERQSVEDLVNLWIRRSVPTEIAWKSYHEAVAAGAMALFGEKYGEEVRTVSVPGFSLELCGGCHVRNTGEISLFVLLSERGIASGVRRIEALTGEGARRYLLERSARLGELATLLRSSDERVVEEATTLRGRVEELEKELGVLRMKMVTGAAAEEEAAQEVGGVQLLAREVPPAPAQEMRQMADVLRARLGSGVVVLGSRTDEKVGLVVAVTQDLEGRVHAGRLVKELAGRVGGGGGGRPDFAQAGGKDPAALPAALAAAGEVLSKMLAS